MGEGRDRERQREREGVSMTDRKTERETGRVKKKD